uniref:Uncharacterized protein n=1 Tax=Nelumbo nucifera TaxID=4432 RepID=A0A822XXU9_NELNU|nr:TPA_asm: hypothetical protein HUJ06_026644 [Nelumbo nucifera]
MRIYGEGSLGLVAGLFCERVREGRRFKEEGFCFGVNRTRVLMDLGFGLGLRIMSKRVMGEWVDFSWGNRR